MPPSTPPAPHPRVFWVLFALLAVAVPLIFLPPQHGQILSVLETPRVDTPRRLLVALIAGLLLALVLYAWGLRGKIAWRRHPLDLPILLFLAGSLISGLLSAYPRIIFLGPLWCQDSLLLYWVGFALYLGVKEFIRTREEIAHAVFLLVMGGGAMALIGLVALLIGSPFNAMYALHADPRLCGTLSNPMYAGLYLAMLVPLGISAAAAITDSRRRWVIAAVIVMAVGLLLTMARGAYLGMAAALVVLMLLGWRHFRDSHRPLFRILSIAVGVLIAGGVLLVWSSPRLQARITSLITLKDTNITNRLVMWKGAIGMFRARPVQGWGPGTFRIVVPQYRPSSSSTEMGIPINRHHFSGLPHNQPLQIAAEMGLLGLLPFVLLIVTTIITGIRLLNRPPEESWLALGLLGMLTANWVTNLFAFDDAVTLACGWVGLGLLAAFTAKARVEDPRQPARHLVMASYIVATIAVIYFAVASYAAFLTTHALYGTRETPAQCQQAVDDLAAVTRIPLVSQEYSTYQSLCTAYRDLMTTSAQQGESAQAASASKGMVQAGERALVLMDRAPLAARDLALSYIQTGDYLISTGKDSSAKTEYANAHRILDRQIIFEPYSSVVRILYAKLLKSENRLVDARAQALLAVQMDPEYVDALVEVARYDAIPIENGFRALSTSQVADDWLAWQEPEPRQLLASVSTHYGKALELGYAIPEGERVIYTTALLLHGETERAVAQGRLVHDAGLRGELLRRVEVIFRKEGKAAEGRRVIAAMQAK